MPYSASALGVLPPLWSRAAKKPRPVLTFSDWAVFTFLILAPAASLWPRGDDGAISGAVTAVPGPGRRQAVRRRTGRRGTPERTLCRAASLCASWRAAGLFTAHA